jgi:hypothetical protein
MSNGDNATFRRAGAIIAQSRVAGVVDDTCRRLLAAIRTSRSLTTMQRRFRAFRALTAGERVRGVVLATATAVVGHLAMAQVLPTAARPTTALSSLVLLAVCLAASAIAVRPPR